MYSQYNCGNTLPLELHQKGVLDPAAGMCLQADAKQLELAAIEEGLSALDQQITEAALR